MNRSFLFILACFFALTSTSLTKADLVIGDSLTDAVGATGGVGVVEIPLGEAAFEVMVFAVNCDDVEASAFTLNATIGDSIADADVGAGATSGTPNVPGIANLDVDNNVGTPWPSQGSFEFLPTKTEAGINSGPLGSNVAVSGQKMGVVTLDTRGIQAGTYNLSFAGSSFAGGADSTCGDHSILQTLRVTAVPEPSSFLAISFIGLFCGGRNWWKKSQLLEI